MPEAELQTIDMTVNMGPQHPSTHGVFRMVLTIDGEQIVDVEPHIGYLHRGHEKLSEDLQYFQVVHLLDRADYISGFNMELSYVMAVEALMGVEVPERAEFIRVILCELNRIASHMLFYGAFGADAGAITPFLYGFRERERIQALFESVSGARMMHNYFRVGGVKDDLPPGFVGETRELLEVLRRGLEECDVLLTGNEIFVARVKDVGVLSAQDAIDFGVSGPVLRASGVAEDLRRTEPYSVYDRFQFKIPVGDGGDCFDRYLVRIEEMRQSISIVEQALDLLPEGPIQAKVPATLRPKAGEVYIRTEAPRGDFGVYLISQGGDKPYRMKLRSPSYCNLMALRKMMVGCYVADCVMILGSLDIVLGEVDR